MVWELRAGPAGAPWAGARYNFVMGFSGDEKANDASQYIYYIILNFPTQYTLPVSYQYQASTQVPTVDVNALNPQPVYKYCMKCKS